MSGPAERRGAGNAAEGEGGRRETSLRKEDVDRIAGAVVGKLIMFALVVAAAIFIVPVIALALMGYVARATGDSPWWVAVPLLTAVLALPLVVLIWLWGRSRRAR